MGDRTALLIRCSSREANQVRKRAANERRTVSAYLLRILAPRMELDDKLATMLTADLRLVRTEAAPAAKSAGPRTALLLRCSAEEGARIRAAAKRRGATIAGFVLHALRIAWGTPPSTSE